MVGMCAPMKQLLCGMFAMHVTIKRINWVLETGVSSSVTLHWSMTRTIQVTVRKVNWRIELTLFPPFFYLVIKDCVNIR